VLSSWLNGLRIQLAILLLTIVGWPLSQAQAQAVEGEQTGAEPTSNMVPGSTIQSLLMGAQ
jgi:hypothetical protein